MKNHPYVLSAQKRIGNLHQTIGRRTRVFGKPDVISGLMEVLYYQQIQIERLERNLRVACAATKTAFDETLLPPADEGEDIDDEPTES